MSIAAIEYVLRCRKDYYKVLKIEHNASVDEIKRQYKRTSLLCHPDKVDAEHRVKANEAFQVVSTAHSTLSDPHKRAVYDRHGVEGVKQHESGGGGGGMRNPNRQQFQHPFEEFLFNFHRPPPRRPGHHDHHNQQQQFQEVNLNIFMIAPILLFILLAMLLQSTVSDSSVGGSSFGGSGPKSKNNLVHAFSMIPNYEGQMTVKRTTSHPHYRDFAVPYYVSRQWNDYAARGYIDLRKTEMEVLKKHRDSLGRRCESESLRNRGKTGRASHDIPEVCKDYDNIRDRVRG